jgi:nitrite reductase/ring-hydroxylating ferredoxin subunit
MTSAPVSATCKSHQCQRICQSRAISPTVLTARKKEEDEPKLEKSKGSGFSSRFTSNSDKDNGDIEVKNEKEESSGIIRSISKRFEGRKETKEARNKRKEEAKLAKILEKESNLGGFPMFNTSGVASAFRNVSASLNLARDEIRSIRVDKVALTPEEEILEKLRKQTEAQRRKRIIAQQLADQRTVDRRKKRDFERLEAKKNKLAESKQDSEDGEEDDESDKRSNPLSVAQKYFSGWFEGQKDKEEWLVVAPKTRISPGEMVPVTAAGLDLLLVASKDGSALYCIENSCPHLGTPLEVGMLERRPTETSANSTSDDASGMDPRLLQETDITKLLTQDGCEDCIVCPLHKTAFALESGEVRGEWCPYPPVIGKVMGIVKTKSTLPIFDVRTKGKNIEVRLNTPFQIEDGDD